MKLVSVQITEYKSVRDSGPFAVGDVTCLVGKNEAGKTAILESLYRLNPVVAEDGNFNVTNDYPRVDVEDYQHAVQTRRSPVANVVTAIYELADSEVRAVEEDFGAGVFVNRQVTLKKGYENKATLNLNLNESVAVKALVERAEFPSEVRENALKQDTLAKLSTNLSAAAEAQDQAHKVAMAAASGIADAAQQAQAKDDAAKLQESQSAKQLRADLSTYLKPGFQKYVWDKYLGVTWPEFLYFDEYYQMEGQVNIQALKDGKQRRRSRNQIVPCWA